MFPDGAAPLAVGLLLVGLLLIGGGLAFVHDGVTDYQNEQADLTNAVETTGTIHGMRLVQVSSGGEYSSPEYKPEVRYSYVYQGTTYTSTSVYSGPDKTADLNVAQDPIVDYDSNQTVTVYVNAEHPSRSYLQVHPGGWFRYLEQYGLLLGFFPFGFWLVSLPVRSAYRHTRRKQASE